MCRAVCPILVACLALGTAWGDEKTSLKDAVTFQETLEQAIQQAEPSIACILVSQSDGYRKLLKDSPPPDQPGKLGGFDLERARTTLGIRTSDPAIDPRGAELQKLDLGDPSHVPESYGSGVVVDEKGLVLTNYHVVRDATKLFVRLPGRKEGSYADIHAADPRSDLAVLRLLDNRTPCKAIKLGDGGKVRKGQLVLTIANPFAAGFQDGSPSASWGIVSNLRRKAPPNPRDDPHDPRAKPAPGSPENDSTPKTLHQYGTLIQTDARLNLGCSGGALIDLKGELIGLTTARAAVTGTETTGAYAVPMDVGMRGIVDVLRQGKEVEYGFLGVELPTRPSGEDGVQVAGVSFGSPAFRAGIRHADTIVSINGQPIRGTDDLFLAIGTALAGSQANVEIRKLDGTVTRKKVVLAKYYFPEKSIASDRAPSVRGLRIDYTSLLPQIVRSTREIPAGVLVTEVHSSSPAETAQVRVHDVIMEVNGRAVTTPTEFYEAVRKVTGPLHLKLLGDPPRTVKID
jgi:S1-C subfamily serine protease